MSKASKAALLSGLVFPGIGYFGLKRSVRGVIVVLLSTVCLWWLVNSAMNTANAMVDKLMSGEVSPDVSSVSRLVAETPADGGATWLGLASYGLLACWIFSIVDGYRIGRAEDRKAENTLSD